MSLPTTKSNDWAQMMEEEFEAYEDGQVVVYLDGEYIPIDAEVIEFDGMFAAHKLDLPASPSRPRRPKSS